MFDAVVVDLGSGCRYTRHTGRTVERDEVWTRRDGVPHRGGDRLSAVCDLDVGRLAVEGENRGPVHSRCSCSCCRTPRRRVDLHEPI